jgi:hypothetical protein
MPGKKDICEGVAGLDGSWSVVSFIARAVYSCYRALIVSVVPRMSMSLMAMLPKLGPLVLPRTRMLSNRI